MDRILINTSALLAVQFYVDETATDPSPDSATVTIVSADGTAIATDAVATNAGVGKFTYVLPAQSDVHQLTATWTATFGGVPITVTTTAEIVGGYYCSLAEIRAADPSLASTSTYPWDALDAARAEAEDEAETIMGRSFVRRYAVERLVVDDNGNVQTSRAHLQKLRKVTATRYGDAVAVELDACKIIGDSLVRIPVAAGSLVELHYEHGLDGAFAAGVVGAVRIRARQFAQSANSRVPLYSERVVVDPNGATVTRMLPGAKTTGVAEVDAVYGRLSFNFGFA